MQCAMVKNDETTMMMMMMMLMLMVLELNGNRSGNDNSGDHFSSLQKNLSRKMLFAVSAQITEKQHLFNYFFLFLFDYVCWATSPFLNTCSTSDDCLKRGPAK